MCGVCQETGQAVDRSVDAPHYAPPLSCLSHEQ